MKPSCPVCGCPLIEGLNGKAYMCPNEGGDCTVAGYLVPKLFWETLEKEKTKLRRNRSHIRETSRYWDVCQSVRLEKRLSRFPF